MALLGPAPAAVIAVSAVLVWSIRNRRPAPLLLQQHRRLRDLPGRRRARLPGARRSRRRATRPSSGTAAIVFGVYLAVNFLNFLLIVGYLCLRDGTSLARRGAARVYVPVLPWEVATGHVHRRHRARLPGDRAAGGGDARLDARLVLLAAALGGGGAVAARRAARAGRGARGAAPRRDPRDGRDAGHARPHDRAPLGGGGALRQGDRGRRPGCRRATRSSSTRPACCTTWASSPSPTTR